MDEGLYSDGTNRLINPYFTKGSEFKSPFDPAEEETGNIIFIINKKFASMDSLQRHEDVGGKNDYIPEFFELVWKYGKFFNIGGTVFHSIEEHKVVT